LRNQVSPLSPPRGAAAAAVGDPNFGPLHRMQRARRRHDRIRSVRAGRHKIWLLDKIGKVRRSIKIRIVDSGNSAASSRDGRKNAPSEPWQAREIAAIIAASVVSEPRLRTEP